MQERLLFGRLGSLQQQRVPTLAHSQATSTQQRRLPKGAFSLALLCGALRNGNGAVRHERVMGARRGCYRVAAGFLARITPQPISVIISVGRRGGRSCERRFQRLDGSGCRCGRGRGRWCGAQQVQTRQNAPRQAPLVTSGCLGAICRSTGFSWQ